MMLYIISAEVEGETCPSLEVCGEGVAFTPVFTLMPVSRNDSALTNPQFTDFTPSSKERLTRRALMKTQLYNCTAFDLRFLFLTFSQLKVL